MSYQVLARKWRPKSFATLVGQEHVVRALSHALATGRLHHAWLFTGTRGVGKTTISRILAKALNCEIGVSAEPCGQCAACLAIDADRFPDYVEMDAASNRGVDDMAALLDKAVYAPTQGRYKVYMIDEVHMLTGHAFNAMLKTLEEPPEHVKFILATTDPQKIPVTVLSRCLQFNLKQMPPGHIVEHLTRILQAEAVSFEASALRCLAKAANGSMRDALSLLDQAIAHGAGKVDEEQVAHMLGTVGDDYLYTVFDALLAGDADTLLAAADDMAARSLSFGAALQSLASLLHRIAVLQFAPAALAEDAERARLQPYADGFDAEYLQLAYQIAIRGRDELALAPDEQTGFTMTLLRLHAFRPEMPPLLGGAEGGGAGRVRALPGTPVRPDEAPSRSAPAPASASVAAAEQSAPAAVEAPAPAAVQAVPEAPAAEGDVPPWEDLPPEALAGTPAAPACPQPPSAQPAEEVRMPAGTDDWHALLRTVGLGGMVRELAQHCEWLAEQDGQVRLRLSNAHRHLLDMNAGGVERLQDQLSAHLGRPLRFRIEVGEIADTTPAQRDQAEKAARHAQAVAALEADPFVRELIERFDATLLEASVRPL